jgi:hypothetical protein
MGRSRLVIRKPPTLPHGRTNTNGYLCPKWKEMHGHMSDCKEVPSWKNPRSRGCQSRRAAAPIRPICAWTSADAARRIGGADLLHASRTITITTCAGGIATGVMLAYDGLKVVCELMAA